MLRLDLRGQVQQCHHVCRTKISCKIVLGLVVVKTSREKHHHCSDNPLPSNATTKNYNERFPLPPLLDQCYIRRLPMHNAQVMDHSNSDKGEVKKKTTNFTCNLRSVWCRNNPVQDCSLEKENCEPINL